MPTLGVGARQSCSGGFLAGPAVLGMKEPMIFQARARVRALSGVVGVIAGKATWYAIVTVGNDHGGSFDGRAGERDGGR
jgi:hypothetical protein